MAVVASPSFICDWEGKFEATWPYAWPINSQTDCYVPTEPIMYQPMPSIDLKPIWHTIFLKSGMQYNTPASVLLPHYNIPQGLVRNPPRKRKSVTRSPPRGRGIQQKQILATTTVSESKTAPDLPSKSKSYSEDDLSRPLHAGLELPQALREPHRQRQVIFDESPEIQRPLHSCSDLLFSSVVSDTGGITYEPGNLCDLCRKPFETDDERALSAHLAQHMHDFENSHHCNDCKLSFAHKKDLDLHLLFRSGGSHFSRAGRARSLRHCPSDWDEEQHHLLYQLRNWEQAQLQLYSRTIDKLCKIVPKQKRSTSLPPKARAPFTVDAQQLPTETPSDHVPALLHMSSDMPGCNSSAPTADSTGLRAASSMISDQEMQDSPIPQSDSHHTDSLLKSSETPALAIESEGNVKRTVHELQRRVVNLMERIQARSPSTTDQGTPYSDFCDSHSLPGSPERIEKDIWVTIHPTTERAKSEPPLQIGCLDGLQHRQTAPYWGYANEGATGFNGTRDLRASGSARKRGNWDRNSGGDDDEGPPGDGSPQKRRRLPGSSSAEEEKRFPCIFHIGEPQRYASDLVRHKHISNMCRHLKSHEYYVCSTCVLYFPNVEDLDLHLGCHIKACRKKGCKRTRPAFDSEPSHCQHVMSAEDQWRSIFNLRFKRTPPDIPATNTAEAQESTEMKKSTSQDSIFDMSFEYADPGVDVGKQGLDTLTHSLFEQRTNTGLELALTPPLDIDEFLVPDVTEDSDQSFRFDGDVYQTFKQTEAKQSLDGQHDFPMLKVVSSLQQQVTSMETLLSSQTGKEKDRIFSLQTQVAQLEQKLFQSSERERQLEATLGVVFDAFHATGAPQAQPNKALWNLVMSHSSQAISSATNCSGHGGDAQGESVNSVQFSAVSPLLPVQAIGKAVERQALHPDSAYGSMR